MRDRPGDSAGKNARIFISYRRDDSRVHAGRLYGDLKRHFGDEHVFMDTSGIKGAEDFVRVLEERLDSCEVVLVVIGRQWLKLLLEKMREKDRTDWVYLEIVTALRKHIPVIPVLVDGAPMPQVQDLPRAMRHMARPQAVEVRDDPWWDFDVASLIRILERTISARQGVALLLAATLALIGMLFLLYRLSVVPLPSKLDAAASADLPEAALGDELIIEGPVVNPTPGLLLSRAAGPTEWISLELEKAQLSQATVDDLELGAGSASMSGAVAYSSALPGYQSVSKTQCTTSVAIELMEGKLPTAIHVTQNWGDPEAGGKQYRVLDIRSVGAGLVVRTSTIPRYSASMQDEETPAKPIRDDGPGCWKNLTTPWRETQLFFGAKEVESAVAPDSLCHFRFFMSEDAQEPLWQGEKGLFQPFALGSPVGADGNSLRGLQAKAVRIKRSGRDILNVSAVDEKSLLRIDSLEVGHTQLRIGVSGEGFVKVNNEDVVGLFERIRRYPLISGLLVVTTAALVIWLAFLGRSFVRSRRLASRVRRRQRKKTDETSSLQEGVEQRMICPSCGFDNLEGMDRCENCMKSLRDLDVPRADATGGLVRSVMEDDLSRLEQTDTLTVGPDDTAAEVARRMKEERTGCALVVDGEGRLVGIFTEHDVLSKMTGAEARGGDTAVGELMSRNPEALRETDTVASALNKMAMGRYRHVPFKKSDDGYGVASIKNVLKYIAQEDW